MTWLALDTSTMSQSIAVGSDHKVLASLQLDEVRGHGRRLAGSVTGLLERAGVTVADLEGIVVGLGPGSFTGLRVGLALAKGMAAASDAELIGLPSWRSVMTVLPEGSLGVYCCDARKREVYAALHTGGIEEGETLVPMDTWSPDEFTHAALDVLASRQEIVYFCGDGEAVHHAALAPLLRRAIRAPATARMPSAVGLLRLLALPQERRIRGMEMEPIYIRPSEAELSARIHKTGTSGRSDA